MVSTQVVLTCCGNKFDSGVIIYSLFWNNLYNSRWIVEKIINFIDETFDVCFEFIDGIPK